MSINGLPPSMGMNFGNSMPQDGPTALQIRVYIEQLQNEQSSNASYATIQNTMVQMANFINQEKNAVAIMDGYAANGQTMSDGGWAISNVTNTCMDVINPAPGSQPSPSQLQSILANTISSLTTLYQGMGGNQLP